MLPPLRVAVQIIEQAVETLAMIACKLVGNCLELCIAEAGSVVLGLFAGNIFMLHLIAENGEALALDHILILHIFNSLPVGRK